MLRQRLLTVAVLIPILIAVDWAGEPWFSILVAAAAAYATYEFGQLVRRAGFQPAMPVAILFAVGLVITVGHTLSASMLTPLITGFAIATSGWMLGRREPGTAALDWALTLAIPLYTSLLLAHFVLLRHRPLGMEWVLFAMVVTWTTDATAYFVGRAYGRRKLAPAFSPRKTVEGALGGGLAALVTALIFARLLDLPVTLPQAAALGITVGIAAELGDLVESAFKRSLHAEDAGQLFPGHGGLLDRMDSLVFAAVVLYYIS